MTLQLYLLSLVSAGSASPRFPGRDGSRMWGQNSRPQEEFRKAPRGLARDSSAGDWCQGCGATKGFLQLLERDSRDTVARTPWRSLTFPSSARKLWSQPGGSCALLFWVCFSILRNHLWQVPGGHRDKELRREWEGDVTLCQRDSGPISAAWGCHPMALPLQGMRLSQPCCRDSQGPFPGEAKAGLGVLVGQCCWGGEVRRALDCNQTGEGGVSPRQEGAQPGFFMTPAAWATPARGRRADKQQVLRAKGTESTGVTQM